MKVGNEMTGEWASWGFCDRKKTQNIYVSRFWSTLRNLQQPLRGRYKLESGTLIFTGLCFNIMLQ